MLKHKCIIATQLRSPLKPLRSLHKFVLNCVTCKICLDKNA